MDDELLDGLVCPVDGSALRPDGDSLVSTRGRRYPVVEGVPVLLVPEGEQTIELASTSLRLAREPRPTDELGRLYLETVGVSPAQRRGIADLWRAGQRRVDPVIAYLVAATSGIAYQHLVGELREYPIPELRLPSVSGPRRLLDVGCSWGRWSTAAARKGYTVTGIDPSLGAVLAARRMTSQLGVEARFVVGDARRLPFAEAYFDQVFSYSVIQHFSRSDATQALRECGRVLRAEGRSLIQMAHRLGVRSLQHLLRRRFRDGSDFEVRYWSRRQLLETFEAAIGPSSLSVDCYFGLGLQPSDRDMMGGVMRLAVDASERLRHASESVPLLAQVADSLYVTSRRAA